MKLRTKFFFIFLIISVFTFLISYLTVNFSVRKITEKQTEQNLNTALYTNYTIVKNLIDKFNSNIELESKARNIFELSKNRNSVLIEKECSDFFKSLDLDYLTLKNNDTFIYLKTDYKNLNVTININSLENNKVNLIMTEYGLLIITKIEDGINNNSLIAGKLINQYFFDKLYQENINIVFYWNNNVFLSSNNAFQEKLPSDFINNKNYDFNPSNTYSINWVDRVYKVRYQKITSFQNNNLYISAMISNTFEDQIFYETIQNTIFFLVIFVLFLLIFSFYISNNFIDPFHKLTLSISKKDKKSIKDLLLRKDEIGSIANDFWNITEDSIKQQEQKEKINSLIAHDLKTPLVAITRSLENIRDKESMDKTQRVFLLNLMIKHANQSLELINNLLKVQKYELGKMNLFVEEDNINNLIKECTDGLTPIAEQKEIVIKTDIDQKTPLLMFDRTEMMRVINNLLSNAIKYTDDEGTIEVSSKLLNDKLKVSISDNGKGISFFDQKKMFNFYKTNYENESREGQDISTGLGLYLCKQIVEAHGGEIGFESYKNKGSTFYFFIPVR